MVADNLVQNVIEKASLNTKFLRSLMRYSFWKIICAANIERIICAFHNINVKHTNSPLFFWKLSLNEVLALYCKYDVLHVACVEISLFMRGVNKALPKRI